jgi:hypothetical protein
MEKSDQETGTATLATTALSVPAADVKVNEHPVNKQKPYKRHFLALLERCEFLQQVKCLDVVLP